MIVKIKRLIISMRMDAMKKEQRWSQIVEYCKSNPSASVDDLVNYLHVSAATVRRDLSEMEEQNMIVREHSCKKAYCTSCRAAD